MARRNGKKNDWLATDDYYGFTRYGSQLKRDFWGAMVEKPLLRNLQEIATPLDDPGPVPFYRGPSYESTPDCLGEVAPTYVGNTTVRTNQDNMAFQVLNLNPGVGEMIIGCTFVVR